MAPSGYSGTPLVKKLGYKEGQRVLVFNAPKEYADLLGTMPDVTRPRKPPYDFNHLFVETVQALEAQLPGLSAQIDDAGMIWVSWQKKSSGRNQGVTEDIIRDTALALGLVDVKVCSVSDEWSGLKLVVRVENRGKR